MTDTNATLNRTITVNMPDYPTSNVVFTLLSSVAIADNAEIFPGKTYTLTLDASGTGSQVLPTPDNTGTLAWSWYVKLPDSREKLFSLAYNASSITLATILTAEVSTTTANDLTALLALYLPLAGGTLTDFLTLHADPTANLHAATKQYADGAGVTDHGALTGLSDDDHTQYAKLAGDTFTGQLRLPTGTSAAPGLTLDSTDTGIYKAGNALFIGLQNSSSLRVERPSSGDIRLTSTTGYLELSSLDAQIRIRGVLVLDADDTTDTAPIDDTTQKKFSIQKLAAPPTNAAYVAFSNNPGTDTFYLVMEEL